MWDEITRQRFSSLRIRERQGVLTAEEQTELDGLYRDIEATEAAYLGPATERRRQETEKLRAINEALRDVIQRKEVHLARMKVALAQFRAEHKALDAELEQLLTQAARAEAEVTG